MKPDHGCIGWGLRLPPVQLALIFYDGIFAVLIIFFFPNINMGMTDYRN